MANEEPPGRMIGNSLLNQFSDIELLDDGRFGIVYKAKFLSTGEWFALKQVQFSADDFIVLTRNVKDEVKALRAVQHINIVHFIQHWYTDPAILDGSVFKLDGQVVNRNLWIQMELYECNLRDWMAQKFEDNEAFYRRVWKIFEQILDALFYCEMERVIHRDVKPENIFMDMEDRPKLGDFGLAKCLRTQCARPLNSLQVPEGDVLQAPELRLPEAEISPKVDVFATGVVLLFMFSRGGSPGERDKIVLEAAIRHTFPVCNGNILQYIYVLVEWMMDLQPEKRPLVSEIRKSPQYRQIQCDLGASRTECQHCGSNLQVSGVSPELRLSSFGGDVPSVVSGASSSSPVADPCDHSRHGSPIGAACGARSSHISTTADVSGLDLKQLILDVLRSEGKSMRTKDIIQFVERKGQIKNSKKAVNNILYKLKASNEVHKVFEEPPEWEIK